MTPRHWPRRAAIVAPLILVNAAAVYGQYGWAYDHLGHNPVIAALFAAAVESIAIYLAFEAHAALMAGDASARLRLASYGTGALFGVLNYTHFASPGYQPNPIAITFGLLSSISPWLWAIRSRSLNRDRLRELGQIDPRAVRFSLLRWALFPVRTFRAFRSAVWAGIIQPAEAISVEDFRRAVRRLARRPIRTVGPVPAAQPIAVPAPVARPAAIEARVEPPQPVPAPVGHDQDGADREPEPVPAASNGKRRPPVPDRRILRRLGDPDAVPRRADGTVPVRLVEDLFGIGQERAVKLLREARLYREAESDAVPDTEREAVPAA